MFKCWNCLWHDSNQCDKGYGGVGCSYSPIDEYIDEEETDMLIEENRYEFRKEFNKIADGDKTGYLSLKNFSSMK